MKTADCSLNSQQMQQQSNVDIAAQLLPVSKRIGGDQSISDEAALAACENTQALVHVACWLGIGALAKDERVKAKQLFEKVVATNGYHWFHYRLAEQYLRRIDNDRWLPWLRQPRSR